LYDNVIESGCRVVDDYGYWSGCREGLDEFILPRELQEWQFMNFTEVIGKRRSIRKYKSIPINEEDLKTILEAARLAPSWANRQCWKYVIVTDQSTKEKLAGEDRKWISEAPVIIAACADPTASGHKPGMDYYTLDIGISMEHLVLAATNLGLGTCWIGAFDESQAKEALGVPEGIRVVAFTPLGYPAEKKGNVFDRKPLGDIVFYNRYGQTVSPLLTAAFTRKVGELYIKGRRLIEKLRNRLAF
jgi:nitroreductase